MPKLGILDSYFTITEFSNCIKELKNSRLLDSISNETIKPSAPVILPFLVTFLNKILEKKEDPHEWAYGMITPISKSSTVDDSENYTGITINSCLS